MKPRKKYNRGVIITAIAVLCVSIYLIVLGINQNAEIPAIQKVVKSYINTYVSYNMLPQQYRTATPNISQTEMNSYISKMDNDIKSYFASGDKSYIYLTDTLKSGLESQISDTTVVYGYTKTISKYTKFDFDNSTVTVTVESNSSYDGPDVNNPGAGRLQLNAVTTDTVVLKKVNGDWKVVYSDINRPSQSNSLGGGIVIKRSIGGTIG